MTQMPKIPFISITTHYYILIHLSLSPVCLPQSWITKCGWTLIYETHPGKHVVYVLPITSILRRLLWFGLEIRGPSRSAIAMAVATAPIAKTTTLPALIQANLKGAGDGCPTYFVNSWALAAGLVPRLLKCNEV